MATQSTPSVVQLRRAVEIAEKIQALQAQLDSLLGGSEVAAGSTGAAAKATGKKRGRKPKALVSSEGAADAAPEVKRKTKRTMSPEAREKIAAAQRKRWAKQRKTAK